MRNITKDVIYFGYFETKERYEKALANADWMMMDMYAALLKNQKELLKNMFAEFLDDDYNNTVIHEKEAEQYA